MNLKKIGPHGISWIVTAVLLLIATGYRLAAEGELGIVGIILFASMAVYFAAYIVLKRDM